MKAINCTTATKEELVEAINKRLPITGIETIGTHCPPVHIDEMGAIELLRSTPEGLRLFPGIENAGIAFVSATNIRNVQYERFNGFIRALQNGLLLIGVGDGVFDEHRNRKEKISSFELVYRYLDLDKTKENRIVYQSLRSYINQEDEFGDNILKNLNDINQVHLYPDRKLESKAAQAMKTLNVGQIAQNLKKGFEAAETTDEQLDVFKEGVQFIKSEIKYQRLFLKACEELDASKLKKYFDLGNDHFGFVIESDNRLMSNAVHRKIKLYDRKPLGVVIVHNSKGQFVIMPQFNLKGSMLQVAGILRQKVYQKRHLKPLPAAALKELGTIGNLPEIYIDEKQRIIMNGSKTDPDTPGLIGKELSLQDIIEAIQIVVEERFHDNFAKTCRSGKCTGSRCPLYYHHLQHCDAVKVVQQSDRSVKQNAHEAK